VICTCLTSKPCVALVVLFLCFYTSYVLHCSLLWPPYGIGQAIMFLPCGFFCLLFFPCLISAVAIGRLPYFHTWCGLSANLGCRSETCCTRLAEIQDAKSRQKSQSGHHRTTMSGYVFASKACIDNRKKNLLSSNISSTCPHNMVNFGQLAAEICWRV